MGEPFRLMVENSHDIFTIRDADGRVRYANLFFIEYWVTPGKPCRCDMF